MAEIKIRKKRPVWIWILLVLIIVGAIIYYLIASGHVDEDDMPRIGPDERIENSSGYNGHYFDRSFQTNRLNKGRIILT